LFSYWVVGAALFGITDAIILRVPVRLLAVDVIATLLGGVTTCALAFLLIERSHHPLLALVLRDEAVERPRTLGIRTRLLLSWALGSGIPLIAIILALASGETLDRARLTALAIFLATVGIVAGGVVVLISARSIADPLESLRGATRRVGQGDLDIDVTVDDAGEVGFLQAGFNQMVRGLRERERLREIFGRHVGVDVARLALETTELGGEARQIGVLFVDVTGSTAMAEIRPPAEVVGMLNAMFEAVVRAVEHEGGWLNKFEGDAALCVFGAPVEQSDYAARTCRAARLLRDALDGTATEHLDVGIGVSCGTAVAGNVGAAHRYEYTVIGDPVNEAARLADVAKDDDTGVVASGVIITAAGDEEATYWRRVGVRKLRGRSQEQSCLPCAKVA
jgi:adenylate cyclase